MRPEFDPERYWTIQRIAHVDRYGVLDGVEIDLRHPDLDPKEWEMLPLGLEDCRNHRTPFIWFPGQGEYQPNDATDVEMAEGLSKQAAKNARWLRRALTPDAFVSGGDKIVIDRVVIRSTGNPFLHPHDQQDRLGFLKIIRQSGKVERLKEPIRFIGRTTFQRQGSQERVLEKIADRILSNFGLSSIFDSAVDKLLEDAKGGYAGASLFWLTLLVHYNKETLAKVDHNDVRDPDWHAAMRVKEVIEQALRIGYFWARAEVEMTMQPLALSGLEMKRAAKKAGRSSGESRRAKAQFTWKMHALDLAKELRTVNPGLSQHRLANEIGFSWKLETEPPGHATLTAYISELEKAGTLPARRK